MNPAIARYLQGTARALASLAGVLALLALVGYMAWGLDWTDLDLGVLGMPPRSALGLQALATAVGAATLRRPQLATGAAVAQTSQSEAATGALP